MGGWEERNTAVKVEELVDGWGEGAEKIRVNKKLCSSFHRRSEQLFSA